MSYIKGKFNSTGVNEVDVELIAKDWNHLFVIVNYTRTDEYRVVKYLRKDSLITTLKTTISKDQARQIIDIANLDNAYSIRGSVFFRRSKDLEILNNFS